jgi:hypothetical protein
VFLGRITGLYSDLDYVIGTDGIIHGIVVASEKAVDTGNDQFE